MIIPSELSTAPAVAFDVCDLFMALRLSPPEFPSLVDTSATRPGGASVDIRAIAPADGNSARHR